MARHTEVLFRWKSNDWQQIQKPFVHILAHKHIEFIAFHLCCPDSGRGNSLANLKL